MYTPSPPLSLDLMCRLLMHQKDIMLHDLIFRNYTKGRVTRPSKIEGIMGCPKHGNEVYKRMAARSSKMEVLKGLNGLSKTAIASTIKQCEPSLFRENKRRKKLFRELSLLLFFGLLPVAWLSSLFSAVLSIS